MEGYRDVHKIRKTWPTLAFAASYRAFSSATAELHSTAQENSKYLASCGKTKCLFSRTNLSKFLLINKQMYFLSTKERLLLKYNEDLFKDLVLFRNGFFFHYTKREKDTIEQ